MAEVSITVRKATESDLPQVAQLHRRMFSDHFLGKFPARVVAKFYEAFLDTSLFIVALDEVDQLAGFVMGGETERLDECREAFMQQRRLMLAIHTLINPRLWKPALARLRTMFGHQEEKPATVSTTSHRLLSIAVNPDSQGRGVASKLVEAFESGLQSADEYGLSVEATNMRAIGFYRKLGMYVDGEWGGSVFFRKSLTVAPDLTKDGRHDR